MSILSNILNRQRSDSVIKDCAVSGDTHIGLLRSHNEDSYLYINNPWQNVMLLGVADGMGGHEGGEVASYLCSHYLLKNWENELENPFENIQSVKNFLRNSLIEGNKHIYHINNHLQIKFPMGTTATFGLLWENKLIIAHAGDSRCYRVRKKRIEQLTVDQSWMTEMIEKLGWSETEASNHPLANTLTNCIGTAEYLNIVFKTVNVQPDDTYIFCSDGVSSLVDQNDMKQAVFDSPDQKGVVKKLIHLALQRGGHDNITAVCMKT